LLSANFYSLTIILDLYALANSICFLYSSTAYLKPDVPKPGAFYFLL